MSLSIPDQLRRAVTIARFVELGHDASRILREVPAVRPAKLSFFAKVRDRLNGYVPVDVKYLSYVAGNGIWGRMPAEAFDAFESAVQEGRHKKLRKDGREVLTTASQPSPTAIADQIALLATIVRKGDPAFLIIQAPQNAFAAAFHWQTLRATGGAKIEDAEAFDAAAKAILTYILGPNEHAIFAISSLKSNVQDWSGRLETNTDRLVENLPDDLLSLLDEAASIVARPRPPGARRRALDELGIATAAALPGSLITAIAAEQDRRDEARQHARAAQDAQAREDHAQSFYDMSADQVDQVFASISRIVEEDRERSLAVEKALAEHDASIDHALTQVLVGRFDLQPVALVDPKTPLLRLKAENVVRFAAMDAAGHVVTHTGRLDVELWRQAVSSETERVLEVRVVPASMLKEAEGVNGRRALSSDVIFEAGVHLERMIEDGLLDLEPDVDESRISSNPTL